MATNEFKQADYLNLGTFRKNGVRVDTPVWFAEQDCYFYVLSNNQAGKVKRLRNSSRCQITPCTMLGSPTGTWHESEAIVLSKEADMQMAHSIIRKKYGWQMQLLDAGAKMGGRFDQRAFIQIRIPD
jgi:PPOX class probable F420-dependent enzyme